MHSRRGGRTDGRGRAVLRPLPRPAAARGAQFADSGVCRRRPEQNTARNPENQNGSRAARAARQVGRSAMTTGTTAVSPNRTSLDVAAIRRHFPILSQSIHGRPLVYLDNAATTQKPQVVIDRLVRYYAEENANVHRGVHALSERATDGYERARETV